MGVKRVPETVENPVYVCPECEWPGPEMVGSSYADVVECPQCNKAVTMTFIASRMYYTGDVIYERAVWEAAFG